MPVLFGRWLRSSVNASSPPAEAPTPTTGGNLSTAHSSAAGRTRATAESGLGAAVKVFAAGVVRRFGRGESEARAERSTLPGRRLPVFFANRHQSLSRRNPIARCVPLSVAHALLRAALTLWSAPRRSATSLAVPARQRVDSTEPRPSRSAPRGCRPSNLLNCNAVSISPGPSPHSGRRQQILDHFADLHELIQTGRLGDKFRNAQVLEHRIVSPGLR